MKISKVLAVCAALSLALAADVACARPGGGFSGNGGFSGGSHFSGHGAYRGGGWGGHSGWRGGGWVGGIYLDPWWYAGAYPYYAYSGVVGYDAYPGAGVEPASPPVYASQGGIATAPPGDWYYCQKPAGYYPYVRSCSQAWERVPATPPGAQ